MDRHESVTYRLLIKSSIAIAIPVLFHGDILHNRKKTAHGTEFLSENNAVDRL